MGDTTPPRLPIMFMVPDSVPAYLPPTSIQAAQLPGITRSLEKLAIPITIMAQVGSRSRLERIRNPVAPAKPMQAIRRRLLPTSPVQRFISGYRIPQTNDPHPPRKSG